MIRGLVFVLPGLVCMACMVGCVGMMVHAARRSSGQNTPRDSDDETDRDAWAPAPRRELTT